MTKAAYSSIAQRIIQVADGKLGMDMVALDVRGQTSVTDCFIFIGANSSVHVQALEDAIREDLAKDGIRPLHTDGKRGHLWRVLDYSHVMVHIMEQKTREFYGIERLWDQGKKVAGKPKAKIKKSKRKARVIARPPRRKGASFRRKPESRL